MCEVRCPGLTVAEGSSLQGAQARHEGQAGAHVGGRRIRRANQAGDTGRLTGITGS